MRKAISKKQRFEIFNRDGFTCRYCGRTVEDGIKLEIDHVISVAHGGDNDENNLVTSCWDCNHGKGKHLLKKGKHSVEKVNELLEQELKTKQEIQEQLLAYYKFKRQLAKAKDPTEKAINKILSDELDFSIYEQPMKAFKKLFEKVGMNDFVKAIEICKAKDFESADQRFKYLCGIMHNMVKQKNDPNYQDKRNVKNYFIYHKNRRGLGYYIDWKIEPYIEAYGKEKIMDFIDETMGERRPSYFGYLLELCEKNDQ